MQTYAQILWNKFKQCIRLMNAIQDQTQHRCVQGIIIQQGLMIEINILQVTKLILTNKIYKGSNYGLVEMYQGLDYA